MRWKVYRANAHGDGPWRARCEDAPLTTMKAFHTWREALEHADVEARTVQVTLPRSTLHPTERHTYALGLLIENDEDRAVYMAPDERLKIAGAIIAREVKAGNV